MLELYVVVGAVFAITVLSYMIWSAFCGDPDEGDAVSGMDGAVSAGTSQDILTEIRGVRACADEALRLARENEIILNRISRSLEEVCSYRENPKPGTRPGASFGVVRVVRHSRPVRTPAGFRMMSTEVVDPIERAVRRLTLDRVIRGVPLSSEEVREISVVYRELLKRSMRDLRPIGLPTERDDNRDERGDLELDGPKEPLLEL